MVQRITSLPDAFTSIGQIERFYAALIDKESDPNLRLVLKTEMTLRKAEFRAAKMQERYATYGPSFSPHGAVDGTTGRK